MLDWVLVGCMYGIGVDWGHRLQVVVGCDIVDRQNAFTGTTTEDQGAESR